MTDLALCWLTVPTAGPVDLIRAAAVGGFTSVGMKVVEPGRVDVGLVGGAGTSVTSAQVAAATEGVAIHRTSGFLLDERYVAGRYDPFLEASAALGAAHVSVIGTDPIRSRLSDGFSDLCSNAAAHGLRVSLEFAPFSSVRTIAAAVDLIRRSEQPTATVLLDALHFFRSGGRASDVIGPTRSAVSLLQLCDAHASPPAREHLLREARTDRLDPGQGDLPLAELLRALPPDLPLEVEVPCLAQRDLPPAERAIRAAHATRAFLAAVGRGTH